MFENYLNYKPKCGYCHTLHLTRAGGSDKIHLKPSCCSYVKYDKYWDIVAKSAMTIDEFLTNPMLSFEHMLNDPSLIDLTKNCSCSHQVKSNQVGLQAIQISLDTRCNLRCVMCDARKVHKYYRIKELGDAQMQILEYCMLNFSGGITPTTIGEPFYDDRFYDLLVHPTNRYKYSSMYILTNGTKLNSDRIANIAYVFSKNGKELKLSMSVDGFDKKTYEDIRVGAVFNDAINVLLELQRRNLLYRLTYVVSDANKHRSAYMFDDLYSLGLLPNKRWSFNILIDHYNRDSFAKKDNKGVYIITDKDLCVGIKRGRQLGYDISSPTLGNFILSN